MKKILLVGGLSLLLFQNAFPLSSAFGDESRLVAKEAQLDLALDEMSYLGAVGRKVGGVATILLGGGMGGLAVVEATRKNPDTGMLILTAGLGAGFVALGTFSLLGTSVDENNYRRYRDMPLDTSGGTFEKLQARVTVGEEFLAQAAERSHRQRLWSGGMLTAIGSVGVLFFGLVDQDLGWRIYGASLSGVIVAAGISQLVFLSLPERMNQKYRDEKTVASNRWFQNFNLELIPKPDGLGLGLAARF